MLKRGGKELDPLTFTIETLLNLLQLLQRFGYRLGLSSRVQIRTNILQPLEVQLRTVPIEVLGRDLLLYVDLFHKNIPFIFSEG